MEAFPPAEEDDESDEEQGVMEDQGVENQGVETKEWKPRSGNTQIDLNDTFEIEDMTSEEESGIRR